MMEGFDIQQQSERLSSFILPRLATVPNLDPAELENAQNLLSQFHQIAAQMIAEKPEAELPGAVIPLDYAVSVHSLTLFAEGTYFSWLKATEMGLPTDIKNELLQNLALDVYEMAKQLACMVSGQELTPGLEIASGDQMNMIEQTAHNALIFYLNEYERKHGPIELEPPPFQEPQETQLQEVVRSTPMVEIAPVAPVPPVAAPVAPTVKPKGPGPHDKYGAVALLLTTLPTEQRAKILRNFNAEEKELIAFYSYPQHIEENLDLTSVHTHLSRFKELLRQGGSSLKSASQRGFNQLLTHYSLENLLFYVKDERMMIQQYLAAQDPLEDVPPEDGSRERHLSNLLSPRLEEILYRYLCKVLPGVPNQQEDEMYA